MWRSSPAEEDDLAKREVGSFNRVASARDHKRHVGACCLWWKRHEPGPTWTNERRQPLEARQLHGDRSAGHVMTGRKPCGDRSARLAQVVDFTRAGS